MKDDNYIFHVHTYRCAHASEDSDEAYVLAAISLGAKSIVFTDHAPFPDDLFGNRMRFAQLQEYISSLKSLKSRFKTSIDVRIGLEIEFLPSYLPYYFALKDNADIDILMIGQHFFELYKGYYSFNLSDRSKEYRGLSEAICAGIETGLFDAAAHPDRIFRHQGEKWTAEMSKLSGEIIGLARERNVLLEKISVPCSSIHIIELNFGKKFLMKKLYMVVTHIMSKSWRLPQQLKKQMEGKCERSK